MAAQIHSRLLDSKHFLLPLLGSRFSLVVAVGVNGRVWVSSQDPRHVIATMRCIDKVDPAGENMDEIRAKAFLGTLDI